MPILSKPSSAARTALIYITVGTLMIIWTTIWYVYLRREQAPDSNVPYYWCAGFGITGLALAIIGLAIGQIGRAARHAELPPPEVTAASIQAEQNAAARAPIIAPVNPAAQAVVPQGQRATNPAAPAPGVVQQPAPPGTR